eukprot:863824_1
MASSRLFRPYRALGFVCDSTPFSLQKLGSANFVTIPVGKSWHVYNCDKLRLVLVGPVGSSKVTAVANVREYTYVANGNDIVCWNRMKHVRTMKGHSGTVYSLMVFGPHLLSVGEDQCLRVWEMLSGECVHCIRFPEEDRVTALMHPQTYLNKVLVGFESGKMELWNIKTEKRVYAFASFQSSVNCIAQSPALDVVGVGLEDGRVVVMNIKCDRSIVKFKQSEGAVTAMSFRTDGFPLLATASAHGHVVVWNLKTRRAHALLRAAHDARVLSAEFLRGQPVLVTAGADNAVKMWIFDAPDGSARLLRSRSGHSAPPTRVRFYGARGVSLLSAARDRALRHCSLIRDAQNCELSQGALSAKARRRGVAVRDLRLPVIGQFDASSIKERQWENILTCHDSERFAYTWKFEQKTIGKHKLCHPTERRGPIRAVALSACGNFGFVATECGHIDRFNMQSGSFRGTYCEKGTDKTAHSAAVVGLVSDSLNRVLVSASRDGTLRFWDFSTKKLLRKVVLSDPATHLIMHRDSELVAVATDALEVLIYDVNTRQLVRR